MENIAQIRKNAECQREYLHTFLSSEALRKSIKMYTLSNRNRVLRGGDVVGEV